MSKKWEKLRLLQKTGTAWDQLGSGISSILQIVKETWDWGRCFFWDPTIPNDQTNETMRQDVLKDRHQSSEQDFHPPAPWAYWYP